MSLSRRRLLETAALGFTSLTAARAIGQPAYPSRPISIVVPYPPGASSDQVARLVQQQWIVSEKRVPIIVENRAGANGNVGAAYVAKSDPDGYRVLLATQPICTINPFIYKDIGFDAVKDLAPLTRAVNGVVCIAVHPSLPVNSVAELIAYAKAHPGTMSYGSAGTGSPQHVGGLLFAERAGFEWTHIPYRGGGPMVNDLLGGQIKVGIVTLSAVKGFVAEKKLRILAIGEKARFAGAPSIPTIAETLPDFELTTWLGFFGPSSLPREISDYLILRITSALNEPTVKARLSDSALPVMADGPTALAQLVASDRTAYQRIIQQHNITAD